MDYPIPASAEETLALRNNSVNEEIVVTAIADLIQMARQQGQSLDQLTAGVLQDDRVLDLDHRKWLNELVVQAWTLLPWQQEE